MSIKIEEGKRLCVDLPLTATSGKVRVKQRARLNDYGRPVAVRKEPFLQSHYIEWQIGYDVVAADKEKLALTRLPEKRFVGANGKEKALYELSEYVFFLHQWKFISKKKLLELKAFLEKLPDKNLFEEHSAFSIKRTNFVEKELNGVKFFSVRVEYPLVIHKFGRYEVVAEIITREKQHAVGVQPMLYLCFPITKLAAETPLLGRTARAKETAKFIISAKNSGIFFEMFKLFGMLSKNHRQDVLPLIDVILKQ